MDPDPPVGDRLAAQIPKLRRLARALACSERDGDALVMAMIERPPGAGEAQRPIARLVALSREQARNDSTQQLHAIDAAMGALPTDQREAIALTLVGGLGYADAAETLDIDVDLLAERLARGREALAQRLTA